MVCTTINVGGTPITPNDFTWVMYIGAGGLIFATGYLIYTGFIEKPQSKKVK